MIDTAAMRAKAVEPARYPEIVGDGVLVSRRFLLDAADELDAGREAQVWKTRVARALKRVAGRSS